jgi:hypothetical protein
MMLLHSQRACGSTQPIIEPTLGGWNRKLGLGLDIRRRRAHPAVLWWRCALQSYPREVSSRPHRVPVIAVTPRPAMPSVHA